MSSNTVHEVGPLTPQGVQGKDAVPFLEKLVVGDVAGIKNGSGSLSVFTNEQGGIIDDTVITKVCSCMLLHVPLESHARILQSTLLEGLAALCRWQTTRSTSLSMQDAVRRTWHTSASI